MAKQNKNIQSNINLSELSDMSGEKNSKQAPKYVLPSLKMNGKDGIFYRTKITKDETLEIGDDGRVILEDVGDSLSGVILIIRRSYFHNGIDSQLYTNETDNTKNAKINVLSKSETARGFTSTLVFQGTADQVKQRFPEIGMMQIIYFLLQDTGEIVRLKVKGMSLSQFFSYFKEFEKNEHIFEFITQLGSKKDKNKFGSFYVNTFKKGERVENMAAVETAVRTVYENLMNIEEYYEERTQEPIREEEIPVINNTEIPVMAPEEEIDNLKVNELEDHNAEPTKEQLKAAGLDG
jgi:hypothetical protein